MPTTTLTKKQENLNDKRIERLYRERCYGIEINIMDITKVFRVGREGISLHLDDQQLGDRIHTYVQSIRVG